MNTQTGAVFDGETFVYERDSDRLTAQLNKVQDIMVDHQWHTLMELSQSVGAPTASVSARLRDLRKEKFGSHTVQRRYVEQGVWEYRLEA